MGEELTLERAREIIEQQEKEIDRLRRRIEDERLAEDLRAALMQAATAGTLAVPVTHSRLLEMIVETAAHVINANAGSLFLLDRATDELVFEVALGQKAEEVKKFRVPLGHGIAGLVAVSGQPMAISDAESDPRQASDIAQQIDYKPNSILCVPLFYEDEVIGVLELLDKIGAPSFSPEDMEALWLFANQAAVAIEQSRTNRSLVSLVAQSLDSLQGVPDYTRQGLRERTSAFAAQVEEDPAFQAALDLARVVTEISGRGVEEGRAVRTILQTFAQFLRTQRMSARDYRSVGGSPW